VFALRTYDLELDNNIVSYNPFVSNYLLSYLLYNKIINYTYTVMWRQEEDCQQFVSEFGYMVEVLCCKIRMGIKLRSQLKRIMEISFLKTDGWVCYNFTSLYLVLG